MDLIVTARTKSTQSILDKCGRLTHQTQNQDTPKYRSVLDIIDVNGCRITCSNSSEIMDVIQTLQADGFEFLELDNKYSDVRKDGAYKVVPCTIRDLKTGVCFELQITTITSTTVTDLFHNIIYKKEAIALGADKLQERGVLRLQRLGALVETASLDESSGRIDLTKKMSSDKLPKVDVKLTLMISSVREYRRIKSRLGL